MDDQQLRSLIAEAHRDGKRVAVSFCSHVPQEILIAAGLISLRVLRMDAAEPDTGAALPSNLCPLVKVCYSLCETGPAAEADLIIAETSCDGKKKMYELLTQQDKVCYYQVPQGEERAYSLPLIRSECEYLIHFLQERFGIEITDEKLRQACTDCNEERQSVMDLMALQQQSPPMAWGLEILKALEDHRRLLTPAERAEANRRTRNALLNRKSPVPAKARRILLTGCPIGGVAGKLVGALEASGGVAVCFETCDVVKSHQRTVNVGAEDIVGAIAACYQQTACAIMSPNMLRFELLDKLIETYQAEAVVDLALNTCHSYTVERDRLHRFCTKKGVPYLSVETGYSSSDAGQLATRIAALIELL